MAESEELEGSGRPSRLFLESGSQSALEATQLKWNLVSTTTGGKNHHKTQKKTKQTPEKNQKAPHTNQKNPQNQTSLADVPDCCTAPQEGLQNGLTFKSRTCPHQQCSLDQQGPWDANPSAVPLLWALVLQHCHGRPFQRMLRRSCSLTPGQVHLANRWHLVPTTRAEYFKASSSPLLPGPSCSADLLLLWLILFPEHWRIPHYATKLQHHFSHKSAILIQTQHSFSSSAWAKPCSSLGPWSVFWAFEGISRPAFTSSQIRCMISQTFSTSQNL